MLRAKCCFAIILMRSLMIEKKNNIISLFINNVDFKRLQHVYDHISKELLRVDKSYLRVV